jgi:hypothetical protein
MPMHGSDITIFSHVLPFYSHTNRAQGPAVTPMILRDITLYYMILRYIMSGHT